MKKAEEMARKVVLATTKIDGAYYLFARKLGMKEHILTVLSGILSLFVLLRFHMEMKRRIAAQAGVDSEDRYAVHEENR